LDEKIDKLDDGLDGGDLDEGGELLEEIGNVARDSRGLLKLL